MGAFSPNEATIIIETIIDYDKPGGVLFIKVWQPSKAGKPYLKLIDLYYLVGILSVK